MTLPPRLRLDHYFYLAQKNLPNKSLKIAKSYWKISLKILLKNYLKMFLENLLEKTHKDP